MDNLIKRLIDSRDFDGLRQSLAQNPNLVNEAIPFDEENPSRAHPLHRICDGVFLKKYTDEDALQMAKLFLEYGADINGGTLVDGQDTPLIAASSLHADRVAAYYIDNGANVNHGGCDGGTALHWAAWCGREEVVRRLLEAGAEINKRDTEHKATPLFWAILGSKHGGTNAEQGLKCAKILLQSGADKSLTDADGETVFDLINDQDVKLKELLD